MNEENNKNTNTQEYDNPPPNMGSTSPQKKPKKHIPIFLACAIIFVAAYLIVNITSLSDVVSSLVSVFSPVILGFAIAYFLNPLLKIYEFKVFKGIKNKKLLRGISLIMTYVTTITILVAFFLLIIPELINSITSFGEKFGGKISGYVDTVISWINGALARVLGAGSDAISKDDIISALTKSTGASGGSTVSTAIEFVIKYGTAILVALKNFIVALFISIYVLISKERIGAQVNKGTSAFLSKKSKDTLYRYAHICNKAFSGFFIGVLTDALFIFFICLIVFNIFNIPFATLVATIVAVTNVIPFFGPFIGSIPSFFIILIESPSKAFLFVLLILIIQQFDGNVVAPKILGNSTGLSSLGVIVSITIMGEFFGLVGMLLGVPIFAIIVTLINEFTENKLRKKNMPVNTAEYYSSDSLVDPYEERSTLLQRIVSVFKKKPKDNEDSESDKTEENNKEEK